MPSSEWHTLPVGECLNAAFAGEWGADPAPASAVVLRATDIDDDGHVVGAGAPRAIPPAKLLAKRLQHGDVLLEGSGGGPDKPVGRVALFEAAAHAEPAVCSNFFKTLRPNPAVVDPRLLWRKLHWLYRQPALLAMQQQTTGIINLKFGEYLKAAIELPRDLQEQVRIAAVLDTLDTTIRHTEAIIEKLKQVKQGLLHDLLTRGIDANGEMRPPHNEAPDLYAESPFGTIPATWRPTRVGELIAGSPKNGIYKPAGDIGSGVLLVGQTALTSEGSIDCRQARRARLLPAEVKSFGLQAGDILVSRVFATREGVGQPALVPPLGEEAVYESNMMRLRVASEFVEPKILFHMLQHQSARAWVMSRAFASNQASINRGTVDNLPVRLPPKNEQAAILEVLRGHEARLLAEVSSLSKATALKWGLMDDLLTGRVRVTTLLPAP